MTESDLAWCAEIAEKRQLNAALIEESLSQLKGDRLLLENVLTTASMESISPAAVIEWILERRG